MARTQVDSHIFFSIVCALTVALFLGLIAYLSRDTCDDTVPSPIVRIIAGATQQKHRYKSVRGLERSSIVILPYKFTDLRVSGPKKNLIDYDPAGPGHEPVLRWLNDATLSVDLGRVYWVNLTGKSVHNIHIIYIYSKVNPSS